MSGVCASQPVRDPQRLLQIEARRAMPDERFSGLRSGERLLNPTAQYEVSFGLTPDPLVRERVDKLFEGARLAIAEGRYNDTPGYIYVFHDNGDDDDVLKIGRTERRPNQRVAEWNRTLSTTDDAGERNVVMLFAYPTMANVFAERIVQETLRCEHLRGRLSVATGEELTEFFRIKNFLALKVFLRQTLAYIDWLFGKLIARRR